MKKLLLSAFILLCCISQSAAWMNVTTVGGGVTAAAPPACNTVQDSRTSADNYDYTLNEWIATNFTTSAAYTACKISVPFCLLTSDTGYTITAYIYTSSSGHPGTSLGTSTNTINVSTVAQCSTYTDLEFEFSGVNLSNATEYWIVLRRGTPNFSWQWNSVSEANHDLYHSTDGTTWTLMDADIGGLYEIYR